MGTSIYPPSSSFSSLLFFSALPPFPSILPLISSLPFCPTLSTTYFFGFPPQHFSALKRPMYRAGTYLCACIYPDNVLCTLHAPHCQLHATPHHTHDICTHSNSTTALPANRRQVSRMKMTSLRKRRRVCAHRGLVITDNKLYVWESVITFECFECECE